MKNKFVYEVTLVLAIKSLLLWGLWYVSFRGHSIKPDGVGFGRHVYGVEFRD